MADATLDYMKKYGIKITRQNYLALAHLGDDPKLDAETEAMLPKEIKEIQKIRGRKGKVELRNIGEKIR